MPFTYDSNVSQNTLLTQCHSSTTHTSKSEGLPHSMPFIYASNVKVPSPASLSAIHLQPKCQSHKTFFTQCLSFKNHMSSSQDLPLSRLKCQSQKTFLTQCHSLTTHTSKSQDLPHSMPFIYDSNVKVIRPSSLNANYLRLIR